METAAAVELESGCYSFCFRFGDWFFHAILSFLSTLSIHFRSSSTPLFFALLKILFSFPSSFHVVLAPFHRCRTYYVSRGRHSLKSDAFCFSYLFFYLASFLDLSIPSVLLYDLLQSKCDWRNPFGSPCLTCHRSLGISTPQRRTYPNANSSLSLVVERWRSHRLVSRLHLNRHVKSCTWTHFSAAQLQPFKFLVKKTKILKKNPCRLQLPLFEFHRLLLLLTAYAWLLANVTEYL